MKVVVLDEGAPDALLRRLDVHTLIDLDGHGALDGCVHP
jgi:hypothetical protein